MLRMLLSLLVLMSGLNAVGTPSAFAASASRAEVACAVQGVAGQRVCAHVVAHAAEVARPAQPLSFAPAQVMRDVVMVATVRLRVDRARE
jgi:hypothetical protein